MTSTQTLSAEQTRTPRPTCKCGFDRTHHMVTPENEYKLFDKILVMVIGTTCIPIRTRYTCRQCHETFDETTNPEELKRNI